MLPLSLRTSLALLALGGFCAVACQGISLSSSNGSNFGAGSPGANPTDADLEDASSSSSSSSGGDIPVNGIDAGIAPAITGNPLCNYGFATSASHICFPDTDNATSQQCLQQTPPTLDAGVADAALVLEQDGAVGQPLDAGTVAPVDAAALATPACHVVLGNEADGGPWTTQRCETLGTGTDGTECEKSTDCAASYECVGTPGQCRHYCCGGNDVCTATYAPSFCDVQPVSSSKLVVPVCMPISGCALFGSCPTGETCAVVKDDGTTSCVEVGTAKEGDSCDATHCESGLTCLGNDGARTCFKLCHVASTTECSAGKTCTGSAQLFTNPEVGICQ